MCGRGRAGVRQERTAQYGGRMFVFAATLGVQGDRACCKGVRHADPGPGSGKTEISCTHRVGSFFTIRYMPKVKRHTHTKPSEGDNRIYVN